MFVCGACAWCMCVSMHSHIATGGDYYDTAFNSVCARACVCACVHMRGWWQLRGLLVYFVDSREREPLNASSDGANLETVANKCGINFLHIATKKGELCASHSPPHPL